MRRFPLIATLIVALAVAAMIGLGVWQLQRMKWKDGLLNSYASAQGLPSIDWPVSPDPQHPPLFRRASADCARVVDWRSGSGRNRAGEPGWVHIAECRTPAGADMQVVVGWSQRPDPVTWQGGRVSGIIAPDSQHIIRLVSDRAAAGLEPAQPPSLDDVPNNHFAYAIQWFLFAGVAVAIYILALRGRSRSA